MSSSCSKQQQQQHLRAPAVHHRRLQRLHLSRHIITVLASTIAAAAAASIRQQRLRFVVARKLLLAPCTGGRGGGVSHELQPNDGLGGGGGVGGGTRESLAREMNGERGHDCGAQKSSSSHAQHGTSYSTNSSSMQLLSPSDTVPSILQSNGKSVAITRCRQCCKRKGPGDGRANIKRKIGCKCVRANVKRGQAFAREALRAQAGPHPAYTTAASARRRNMKSRAKGAGA